MTDVCANELDPEKLVGRAVHWASALVKRAEQTEAAGRENAIHTAARWANVEPGKIWALLYRPPRELGVSTFLRLESAHQKRIESVEAKVAENLIALKALPDTPARQRLVAELEGFLAHPEGEAP